MDVYLYLPLNFDLSEIRVMILFPGSFDSPIAVSLSSIALDEIKTLQPPLEALSYAWGPPNEGVDITVEGRGTGHKDGILSITANLAEALKYLRDSTAARLVWIDAICINQQDLEERGSQVRLMSKIYSTSKRVVLWVGPKSEDSDLALDCISKIASRVKVHWQTTHLYPTTNELDWADHEVPLPLSDSEHAALFSFYSRSWFERLWVWQEVHLVADALLLCGARSVPWKSVRTGVVCLGVKPRPGMVKWPAPEPAFSICAFTKTESYTLSALLHETKDSKCSDPRDKVYALLSFLDQELQSGIIPNYTMSAREVYKNVMLQHFKIGHPDGPKLLSTAEMQNEEPDSPSWVPRWDLPRLTTTLYHGKASLATLPSVHRLSETIMEALGVCVSKIDKVEPIDLTNEVSQEAIVAELRRLREQMMPAHAHEIASQILCAFLETLTAKYVAERHHPPYGWRPSIQDYKPFLDIVFGGNGLGNSLVERLLRNIQEFGPGRALCTTRNGTFCLSPIATRSGDLVVIFLGCECPLILRPTSPDCGEYWVVGEAFCHGVMDGEALLGPLPEHWRIVIRHDRPSNINCTAFWNTESQQMSAEDPRLGHLSEGWRRKSHSDEEYQTIFVWENNGEYLETWEDPRIATSELRLKGVQLKSFKLV